MLADLYVLCKCTCRLTSTDSHTLEERKERLDELTDGCDDTLGTKRRKVSAHEGVVSKPLLVVASTANSHDATPSTLKELSLNCMPFPSSRHTHCIGRNDGGDSQSDMAVLRPFFSWRDQATSFRSRFWRECSTACPKLSFMPLLSVGSSSFSATFSNSLWTSGIPFLALGHIIDAISGSPLRMKGEVNRHSRGGRGAPPCEAPPHDSVLGRAVQQWRMEVAHSD